MSDDGFFREVDEELRSDRVRRFWDRYGRALIALAVLFVIALAGYRIYEHYRVEAAEEAGDRFLAAIRLLDEDKRDDALAALRAIEADGNETYRTLARMRIATELAEADDPHGAVALYDTVAADDSADPDQRNLARIRSAIILVDTGTVNDVEQRMTPLAGPANAYRHSARELLGLAYYRADDLDRAFAQFSAVVDDGEAPAGVRQRSEVMLDVIASQGGPRREDEAAQTVTGSVPAAATPAAISADEPAGVLVEPQAAPTE